MNKQRILFIDRDGTLIREPEDEQIDSFEKLRFTEGMFRNLGFIRQHLDFRFVMVSNQDGLGTESFPEPTFWPVHNFILQALEDEGVTFDDIKIDRHFPEDNSPMRKPNTGMLTEYIDNPDYDIAGSYVIGDRETDAQLAENLGCKALILGRDGMTWDKIAEILGCTKDEVEPFIHLSILAINNYMIFAERALFDPQIESVKKELMRLAERKRNKSTTEEN